MAGQKLALEAYQQIYQRSIKDPQGFWGEIAEQFYWHRKWDTVLDNSNPPFFKWFAGGETNLCYNAVDRHVKNGLKDMEALIWEGAAQGLTRTITYGELFTEVNRLAGVLQGLGVQKGDRVLLFMPTIPETVYAMLACVRIGAIHIGIFTGYGVGALIKRIKSAQPKIIITADGSFRRNRVVPLKETVDLALQKSPVDKVIVLNRGITPANMVKGRDMDWGELIRSHGADYVEPLVVESEHPSHIVFTSGDTGNPRGCVNDTGGFMVGLCNSMSLIYGVKTGDVFWATSDIGWRLGHNHMVYGPLLYGITSLLYEGTPDYPDHGVYWRLIEKHHPAVLFTVPTVYKMLKRFGMEHVKKYDHSSVRYLFLAGEYCDIETWKWATEALDGKPVIDHYWLTEAGWPMTVLMAGMPLLPIKPGYAGRSCIGWELMVVNKQGNPLPPGIEGILVAKPPLPPGNITTLWGNDKFYEQEYWRQFADKMLFLCGDYATQDKDGYFAIGKRVDEVINIAGQRVSTREIADAIASHPLVVEACVLGVSDDLKGEEAVGLVVLKAGVEGSSQLKIDLRNAVREGVGAIAAPKDLYFVPSLPKDRKGKPMRAIFQAVLEKQEIKDPTTLEANASPEEIEQAISLLNLYLRL
jgi:propionyl-CoA synthetase